MGTLARNKLIFSYNYNVENLIYMKNLKFITDKVNVEKVKPPIFTLLF